MAELKEIQKTVFANVAANGTSSLENSAVEFDLPYNAVNPEIVGVVGFGNLVNLDSSPPSPITEELNYFVYLLFGLGNCDRNKYYNAPDVRLQVNREINGLHIPIISSYPITLYLYNPAQYTLSGQYFVAIKIRYFVP